MKKSQSLLLINVILFISFIVQTATILVLFFKIEVPNRRLIFEIHKYNGLFMVMLAFFHIALNWAWIKANFFSLRKLSKRS